MVGISSPRRRGFWRRLVAAVGVALMLVGVILVPVAVAGFHVHRQLVDTEKFTATFAPVVQDPLTQELLVATIIESLDIPEWITQAEAELGGSPSRLAPSVELPSWLTDSVGQLRQNAAEQLGEVIEAAVANAIGTVLESEVFAIAWAQSLAQSHAQIIDQVAAHRFGSEPHPVTLNIQPLVVATKEALIASDTPLARFIPTSWEYTATLVEADQMQTIGPAASLAIRYGDDLIWAAAALIVLGVALIIRRLRWAFLGSAVLTVLSAGALITSGSLTPAQDSIAGIITARFDDAITPPLFASFAVLTAAAALSTLLAAVAARRWRRRTTLPAP